VVALLVVVVTLLTILDVVVFRLLIRAVWRELFSVPVDVDRWDPAQVAYLASGPRLAREACVGMLRGAGLVQVTGKWHKLRATGSVPSDLPTLCQAIHRAARPDDEAGDAAVERALTEVRQGLEHAGLLRTAGEQRALNRGGLATLALTLLSVSGGAAVSNLPEVNDPGRWHYWLFWPVLVTSGVVALAGWVATAGSGLPATRNGRRALKDLRTRYSFLHPGYGRASATSDVRHVGMGTALFGTGFLWAYDPKFAEEAGIKWPSHSGGGDGGSSPSVGGDGGDGGGGG
jgi:uncharacterized protein (TIGR04222 family)